MLNETQWILQNELWYGEMYSKLKFAYHLILNLFDFLHNTNEDVWPLGDSCACAQNRWNAKLLQIMFRELRLWLVPLWSSLISWKCRSEKQSSMCFNALAAVTNVWMSSHLRTNIKAIVVWRWLPSSAPHVYWSLTTKTCPNILH